ncbi:acetylornithine deacetylase/succinyl-diaminopimelate desuccinylase-like protein [Povalibacter uvarum]|uniref:Acetylornithine deacetylase/succinyl-diaminopimelate desuccinylase-like protein n=1 Tax=Povalibacter uvarum TaxID=732238 RepID=A0A841HIJ0_9GAMM|nr:M20 family metallopeptidase [Povalibacter uvarum]MBB6092209.1 acetylornithine deacetylase/succinyl-diaminopimelate desuccinylase-like protein [Povalibacter uvarum]
MNTQRLKQYIDKVWDDSIVPTLCDYIRIPNKSQNFDPQWAEHGHMDRAAELMRKWCEANALPGMKVEVLRLPGRTPVLLIEVPGTVEDTVLMYGHMDKQPEFTGWMEGLDPWTPVIRNGRLYGRGGADDGYAVFGSLLALRALADQNIPFARSVILIEAGEESGSPDLPAYIDALADRVGEPSLVVCLDAECSNYDQFWCTTSLRGNLIGTLRVEVLREGVHSGMASGIAASSFRIARQLLARVEDAATGKILIDALHGSIPPDRQKQALAAGKTLGAVVHQKIPFVDGMRPMSDDPSELLLNSTWRPTLSVTGVGGIPPISSAGNVLRPKTEFVLSFRLPPGVDPQKAAIAVKETIERDPPYGAHVTFEIESSMGGWNAPSTEPWLEAAIQSASKNFFGHDAMYMGTGGSIPFMGMLSEKFPRTQFLVTGVLGPHSNAHGPNEFLDIETGKRVTACVAQVVEEHGKRRR